MLPPVDTTPPSTPDDKGELPDNRPYLGQLLFRAVWEGPDTALRKQLVDRFGPALCSRWASGDRRPDGDSRAVIELFTATAGVPILSIFWSTRGELPW